MLSRALRIATLATASPSFSLVAGCAADATLEPTSDVSEPDTLVGSTSSALSTFDWSPSVNVGPDAQAARYGGAMATLNGVTYMVHSGDSSPENLWWTRLDGGQFAVDTQTPNQYASQKASLAAFNGYLYLFHNGQSDTTAIWVSRLDPSTQTWTQNFKLPFTSKYTPAIAAYGGRLRMVGTSPSTNQVWTATLDASETLSPQLYVPNVYSASRLSAAVFANQFHVAHRNGSTTNLAVTRFDGTSWSVPGIPTVGGVAFVQGYEAQIAAHDGYLHLAMPAPSPTATPTPKPMVMKMPMPSPTPPRPTRSPAAETQTLPNLSPDKDFPEPVADSERYGSTLFDVFEFRPGRGGDSDFRWDIEGSYGGDYNRFWYKSEGERNTAFKADYDIDLQLLYGRLISPYFNFQTGVRFETQTFGGANVTRPQAVVGLEGTLPYVIELE